MATAKVTYRVDSCTVYEVKRVEYPTLAKAKAYAASLRNKSIFHIILKAEDGHDEKIISAWLPHGH